MPSALNPATIKQIYSALVSHASATGLFPAGVENHEPLNAPQGGGLAAAVMRGPMSPIRSSGLSSASARLEFTIRIYSTRVSQPAGELDPDMLNAECVLMAAYCGDLELAAVPAGLIRMIDVLGAYGDGLASKPGYLPQDGAPQRVTEITIPLIINDAFNYGST